MKNYQNIHLTFSWKNISAGVNRVATLGNKPKIIRGL